MSDRIPRPTDAARAGLRGIPDDRGPGRRRHRLVVASVGLAATCFGMLAPGPVDAQDAIPFARPADDLTADEQRTIATFQEASPSVVFITSIELARDAFTFNILSIPSGTGSGFIWDDQGHIVTNYHVIRGAGAARVTLNDRSTWGARLVGVAPDQDIAVLRIEAPQDRLKPVRVGTSRNLLVGQKVLAIGNPFGLDQTLTTGVISGLGREIESISRRPIRGVIQTDAAINPGNSGGPLLDSSGRLIGVNTAIFSPSGAYAGVGFAVPVDTVKRIVPQLIKHGRVIRPSLGVTVADDGVARRLGVRGVLVLSLTPAGAAEGLQLMPTRRARDGSIILGDIITAIDDEPVEDTEKLYTILGEHDVGSTVAVTVDRGGRRESMKVKLVPEE